MPQKDPRRDAFWYRRTFRFSGTLPAVAQVKGCGQIGVPDGGWYGRAGGCCALRWLKPTFKLVQGLTDHLERPEAVALSRENVAKPLQVRRRETSVARPRAFGCDEPLGLQEPDLGDGDVREVRGKLGQHAAYRELTSGGTG